MTKEHVHEDRFCDLHLHTTASDGTWSPEGLVRAAREAGLAAIAVTDHDTTAAVHVAQAAGKRLGVEVLAGVELSLRTDGQEVHVLGYGIDPGDPVLGDRLAAVRTRRAERTAAILSRLAEHDRPLDPARVQAIAGRGSIGRPHIARAMVEKGYVASISEAFDRWLAEGRPAFVPRAAVSPADGIAWIRAAGGVSVLAHPGLLKDDRIIPELVTLGLDGIEVYHPSHPPEDVICYLRQAEEHGLLVTGGSDCHGPGGKDQVFLGRVKLPYEHLTALRQLLEKEAARRLD